MIDPLGDLFDQVENQSAQPEVADNLKFLIEKYIPHIEYTIIDSQGKCIGSGNCFNLPDVFISEIKSSRGIVVHKSDHHDVYGNYIKEFEIGMVLSSVGKSLPKYNDSQLKSLIALCTDLFIAHQKISHEKHMAEIQKKQFDRQLRALEEKNQEILEDKHRSYQLVHKHQKAYSKKLKSEIDRQTAELREAYERLKRITNLQQKTLDTAATAIFTVDLNFCIADVNKAFCLISGYTKSEVIGKSISIIGPLQEPNGFKIKSDMPHKATYNQQCTILTKDGRILTVIRNADVLTNDKEQVVGYVESFVDVTDLIRAREKAVSASKAKSEFLANMSHEIRTPLNGIMGMTELVLDTQIDNQQKNLLNIINAEAESLLGLINDILDFSKIEAGKFELEKTPFDLRHVVEELTSVMAIRASQKNLEMACYIAPNIPKTVIGDPTRLKQVLNNLIGNAIKFTSQGEIFIKIEPYKQSFLRFEIHDTGIGIPKEKQKKIFQSFTQADGSTTRKYGGTGLGTTISKQIVELMGGKIDVSSKPEKGSVFRFTALFEPDPPTTQNDIELHKPDSDLPGGTALVVESNLTHQFIVFTYLKELMCTVQKASSKCSAIELLKQNKENPPDFVIVDFKLSDGSGLDLALEIRKMAPYRNMPIWLLKYPGTDLVEIEKIDKIHEVLAKPVKFDDLHHCVNVALGIQAEKSETEQLNSEIKEESRSNPPKGKILLVEDYPTNQRFATMCLQKAGYDVDLAENGQQALDAYIENEYDLILMDIQMPVMDGYMATKAIREIEEKLINGMLSGMTGSDPNIKRIPIIALTAHAIKGFRETCLDQGMDDFITKPLKSRNLLTLLEKWIIPSDRNASSKAFNDGQTQVPSPIKKSSEPIDLNELKEIWNDDQDLILKCYDDFLQNADKQLNIIHSAIINKDLPAMSKASHKFKGALLYMAAGQAADIAFELEQMGDQGVISDAKEKYRDLVRHCEKINKFIQEYKHNAGSG